MSYCTTEERTESIKRKMGCSGSLGDLPRCVVVHMIMDTWNLFYPRPAKAAVSGEMSQANLIMSAITPSVTGLIQIRRKNLRTPRENLCLYYNMVASLPVGHTDRCALRCTFYPHPVGGALAPLFVGGRSLCVFMPVAVDILYPCSPLIRIYL